MENLFYKRFRILYDVLSDTKVLTMTRQEYANYLGVTKNQVAAWLDERAEPSLDSLVLIAGKHRVTVDWLVGMSHLRNPNLSVDNELALLVQERSIEFKDAFIHLLKKI